ncbi:type IV secretion system protein VirB9 [Phyllobacterium myrsinacearum]|uniref:P-type conjugative transfer protein VirB9 n=1 Tax=Phyllobacterium myrsinacearum TaxID=28101 RepID=UPI0010291A65|nr:P-type conjugative transfer protein VirB9 [Phyllobacterium myrsinacearum]RZS76868.1 type IV secretion system protein VirB9 [Phyllobacterium myrsinacearum]
MKKAFLITCALLALTQGVRAEDTPLAGKFDARMRYLSYNPDQVVRLSTAVGATMVVTFGAGETVTSVAVSNSKDLAALPRGNYLFFKASKALSPQPVIVLTTGELGMRRYVFSVSSKPMDHLDKQQSDLYFSVQFGYPADEAAARRKAAVQQAEINKSRAAWNYQQRARTMLDTPVTEAYPGANNWHYVAQGDHSLKPSEVFDNGNTTVFRFPGNTRIPSIYVINPDGSEAAANYTAKGSYIEVSSVARGWRLRDGRTVLCIWNTNFDPVGNNPGTGTVRPDVERVVRGPRR